MILIYPGSFDPPTLGHADIARRGAALATRLVIAVTANPNKQSLFTIDERLLMLRQEFQNCTNIEILVFEGLLADFAQKIGANAILRGLRSPSDFESESRYAIWNGFLGNNIDTIFLTANPELSYISSSIVREVASHTDADGLSIAHDIFNRTISEHVQDALKIKFARAKRA